ncbi:MAG: aminotransferase class V-fold PLP-dependent enzyme, partial [Myxococcota bacterium]
MNAPSLLPNQRHLFDIPSHVTYLNCAYMSPLPRTVVEAGERAVRWKAAPWRITAEDFFTLPQHARQRIATLVGIPSPNAIAVIPAASYGLAVAAANLPLDPGEKIVLLEDQFPSNVYIWREKARLAQAHVHTVARPAWKADGAWPGWSQAVLDDTGLGPD